MKCNLCYFEKNINNQYLYTFQRPEEGSRSIVFCALSQSLEDDEGGLYISNCGKVKPSCLAEDVAEQDKLMTKTMEILNLTEFCGIHK